MVKAVPINKNGEATGDPRSFSDAQWERMVSHFGKTLAYKKIEGPEGTAVTKAGNDVELISTKNAKSSKSKRS